MYFPMFGDHDRKWLRDSCGHLMSPWIFFTMKVSHVFPAPTIGQVNEMFLLQKYYIIIIIIIIIIISILLVS